MPETITPPTCTDSATRPDGDRLDGSHVRREWEVVPRYTSRKLRDGSWELLVDLPGVRKCDLSVSLEDDELEVTASRSVQTPEGWKALRIQRAPDRYRLSAALGVSVDPAKVSAKLENGVLRLVLAASGEKTPRRVTID